LPRAGVVFSVGRSNNSLLPAVFSAPYGTTIVTCEPLCWSFPPDLASGPERLISRCLLVLGKVVRRSGISPPTPPRFFFEECIQRSTGREKFRALPCLGPLPPLVFFKDFLTWSPPCGPAFRSGLSFSFLFPPFSILHPFFLRQVRDIGIT